MRFTTKRILLFAAALSVIAVLACNPAPAREDQDKDWTTAQNLVDTSDRIVTGIMTNEAVELVEIPDEDTGVFTGERDVLYREFRITESFKGSAERDDMIWMAFDPSFSAELVDGSGEPRLIEIGAEYVLFLKGRARPLEFPSDYGAVLWSGNGQPSLAALNGDELQFLSDDVYFSLLQSEGIAPASDDSVAPFTLNRAQLRELTD